MTEYKIPGDLSKDLITFIYGKRNMISPKKIKNGNMDKNNGKIACKRKFTEIETPDIENEKPSFPGNYMECGQCGEKNSFPEYCHAKCKITGQIQACRLCSKCIELNRNSSKSNYVVCPLCNQNTINICESIMLKDAFPIFATVSFTFANVCIYVDKNTTFAVIRLKIAELLGIPICLVNAVFYKNTQMSDLSTIGEEGFEQGASFRIRILDN